MSGSRVRAVSHFPSVRLGSVKIARMTGRWFYECTLLSDGLMQVGWADGQYRCDPVCGQVACRSCVYVRVYLLLFTVYVCVNIYTCVCVYVCTCVYVYLYVHTLHILK